MAIKREISQPELWQYCIEVLNELMCPLHYRDLFELASARWLAKYYPGCVFDDRSKAKNAENLREKLLIPKGHKGNAQSQTFYSENGGYVGGLLKWFDDGQCKFNLENQILIPSRLSSCIEGAADALLRDRYMLKKNPHANPHSFAEGRMRGKTIESIVCDWFKDRWPGFYVPASNTGQYKRPSSDDFALRVPGSPVPTLLVDVFGPTKQDLRSGSDTYTKPNLKGTTHLHLFCRPWHDDFHVAWQGYLSQVVIQEVNQVNGVHNMRSPCELVVWLNCRASGLDYDAIVKDARKARSSSRSLGVRTVRTRKVRTESGPLLAMLDFET